MKKKKYFRKLKFLTPSYSAWVWTRRHSVIFHRRSLCL